MRPATSPGGLSLCAFWRALFVSSTSCELTPRHPPRSVCLRLAVFAFLRAFLRAFLQSALNVFPYPWLMCTVQLGCGVVMMLALWATGIVKAPKVDLKFIKALLPVAAFHLVNHVGVCFALSKSAVGFTHVLKAAEPFYSVTISALLGTFYSPLVYASLVPIVAGISLAVVTELNFSMQAFIATNAANVSTVLRTIISKRMLKDYDIKGINLYAWISIVALAQLVPLAVMIEGHKWQAGWQAGVAAVGVPQLLHLVLASGVLYHLYNQLSYQTLDSVSPVSFSIANALKRVAIIGSAVLFFGTPMTPLNAFGSALAILGTYLYSRAKLL